MGSINIDLVMYMSKLPTAGETVVTDNFQTFSGGKGGNQAATASLLGGNVKYFTKLGTDNFSKELISKQIEYGVDMSNIIIEQDSTAGIAMIRVDESGQNSISFTPGANSLLTPEDVEKNAHIFDDCDILLITMEIQHEIAKNKVVEMSRQGLRVIAVGFMKPKNIDEIPDSLTDCRLTFSGLIGLSDPPRESIKDDIKKCIKAGVRVVMTEGIDGAVTPIESPTFPVTEAASKAELGKG